MELKQLFRKKPRQKAGFIISRAQSSFLENPAHKAAF
jgi:hypothetical protein